MMQPFSLRHGVAALLRRARALRDARDGVAAVEFAFVLPIMLLIYFGIVEVAQGVMIDRKVTQLNRTLADLASQVASIPDSERDNIFAAAKTVMAPYTDVEPTMMFASVVVDANGNAKVCWSEAPRGQTAPSRGSPVTLPTDLRIPNSSIIMARASYKYTPVIGQVITKTIEIGDVPIYMRPRAGRSAGSSNIEQVERAGKASCPGFN